MRPRTFLCCACLFVSGLSTHGGTSYDRVIAEDSSTSIYIGNVTLKLTPLLRENGGYVATYKAKVFPYFFMSEQGSFRIDLSEDDLARIARGETVEFSGRAETTGKEERQITGRASPADATGGKIKVRVSVTKKIQLIFNTTYRFAG